MRFVDGEGVGSDFVDLEPGVRVWHAFEGFVFGAGKEFAPVGGLGLLGFHRTCQGDTEGPEKSQAREIFEPRHFRSWCRWDSRPTKRRRSIQQSRVSGKYGLPLGERITLLSPAGALRSVIPFDSPTRRAAKATASLVNALARSDGTDRAARG